MDTSKQYIDMCDNAGEIQCQWTHSQRNSGDWYFNIRLDKAYVVSDLEQNSKNCIWLPRQDQLQAMLDLRNLRYDFAGGLNIVWNDEMGYSDGDQELLDYYAKFTSLEQCWLAYVMQEKYQKEWNFDAKEWQIVK